MMKSLSVICFVLVLSLGFSVFSIAVGAQSLDSQFKDISLYQEVLDRLNEEFGTEASFPTQEDLIRLENANALEDFPFFDFSLTVEEFEAIVRADIIMCLEACRDSLEAVALLYDRQ
jgi:hypothetical protein